MTTAPRSYAYKGWQLQQRCRGHWQLIRAADGYRTRHDSLEGGKAFIRCHGAAADPDVDYDNSLASDA